MKKKFKITYYVLPFLIVILMSNFIFEIIDNKILRMITYIISSFFTFIYIFLLISKFYSKHWLFRWLFYFNQAVGNYKCTLKYEVYDYMINNKKSNNKQKKTGSKEVALKIEYDKKDLIAKLKTDESSSTAKLIFWEKKINEIILLFEYENMGSNDEMHKKLKPHKGYMELIMKNNKMVKGIYLNPKPGMGTLSFH